MSKIEIKVPNIGDFKDVEIIEVLVKNGQDISKGDPIITLESDKSSVEVPSDYSGKITKLKVNVGDKVSEGDLILEIDSKDTGVKKDNKLENNLSEDIDKIPKEIQKPKKIHFVKPMPLCFEYKPGNNKYVNTGDLIQNIMTKYRYPINCESKYGIFYRPKPAGHWSTPCKKNTDCPFYKSNKNYPNKFGGCKADGYCQMPLNVKPLGYRGYYEEQKPMCYNCKNDAWFPISRLDTCCDEQKNNPKKYPFLKGPEYAFVNDKTVRFNKFFQDH